MKRKAMTITEVAKLGGRARADSMSKAERRELASKAGKARANALSAEERSLIAKRAVAARERKRKQKSKHSKGE